MLNADRINYTRLGQAQTFYKGRGYTNVMTPWLVTPQAVRATLPISQSMIETVRGVLVTKGEQAFIQKMMEGQLEPGSYQTLTPCFQDAAEHHSPYFYGADDQHPYSLQIELLVYKPDDARVAYEKMLNTVMECFFEISDVEVFDAIQTADGFDIAYNKIVLGSFGVRKMGDNLWVYGSGLIEPRFTLALHSVGGVVEGQHTHSDAPTVLETPNTGTQDDQDVLDTELKDLRPFESNVVEMPSSMEMDVDNGHHS